MRGPIAPVCVAGQPCSEPAKNVTLTIDGREVTVAAGTLIIRAAEHTDIYVPRFCDHPYLAPLGAFHALAEPTPSGCVWR